MSVKSTNFYAQQAKRASFGQWLVTLSEILIFEKINTLNQSVKGV